MASDISVSVTSTNISIDGKVFNTIITQELTTVLSLLSTTLKEVIFSVRNAVSIDADTMTGGAVQERLYPETSKLTGIK